MCGGYEAIKSFLKPAMKNEITKITKDTDPHETIQQLSSTPCPTYKGLTKLELTYMTYYEETQVIQKSHNHHCPTCQNSFNSLTRVTIHRKNTKSCISDYCDTKITLGACNNRNCCALLANMNELVKHKSYHCGIGNHT